MGGVENSSYPVDQDDGTGNGSDGPYGAEFTLNSPNGVRRTGPLSILQAQHAGTEISVKHESLTVAMEASPVRERFDHVEDATKAVTRLPSQAGVQDLERINRMDRLPLLEPPSTRRYERWVKPVIDRTGAAILLFILTPVLLIVALALLATLGRPLLIRQHRVGRTGRVFRMFKFRTMLPDRRGLQTPINQERRFRHKTDQDPRHTRIGRFLRRYSVDELPQLVNVLRGEMSLVGPRPELAHVVARFYAPWQHLRHQVKPGVTGLWQVTARQDSNGDMHEHTDVDLEYIAQMSLKTDLRILLRTPLAALGKGN